MKLNMTFTQPQLLWLVKEAKRLGIRVPEVVRRIIDQHRDEKRLGVRSTDE